MTPTSTPADDPAQPVRRSDHRAGDFELQEARYAEVEPRLLVVGDSLGQQWSTHELEAFGIDPVAKLAVSGDLTQNILWRLEHTALALARVDVAVVIAGTNNLSNGDAAEDVLRGMVAIVEAIRRRAPGSRIAVLEPPPRLHRRRYQPAEHARLNALLVDNAAPHEFIAVQCPPLDPSDERFYKDGLHIRRRAYRELTAAVMTALGLEREPSQAA